MKKYLYNTSKIISISLIFLSLSSCGDNGKKFIGHWVNVENTMLYRIQLTITKSDDIFIVEQNNIDGGSDKFSSKLEHGSLKMDLEILGSISYSKESDHIFFHGYELMRVNE